MDSFFGIGFPELVFILIIATLVMGPQRMRQVARTLGRFTVQMQALARQVMSQLNSELDTLDSPELKAAIQEMKTLRDEVDTLRSQVRDIPRQLAAEEASLRQAVDDGKRAVSSAQAGALLNKPVTRQSPAQDEAEETDGAPVRPAVPQPGSLPTPIEVADDPEW